MPSKNSPDVIQRQESFCVNYVANGGVGVDAVEASGYSGTREGMRVTAHRLLRQPHIIGRIHELTKEYFTEDAVQARGVMLDLLGARSELVRFNAAKDILDRAGHRPLETMLHMKGSDALTEDELRDKISSLFDKLKVIDQEDSNTSMQTDLSLKEGYGEIN